MKFISIACLIILSSCSGIMPDIAKIVEDVEDTAICIEVNRDAIKQDTDVHVIVDVINKDQPKKI